MERSIATGWSILRPFNSEVSLRCTSGSLKITNMIELAPEAAVIDSIEKVGNTIAEDDAFLINSPMIEELSDPFIGSWNRLVSQTNWEKGTVILRWRKAMVDAELPHSSYSDEAWARRVGNVTPQHIGRLRRVAERFGEKEKEYPNLFWSHFQTALDWDDAELWLEGAVQNTWSVAQMRVQRWEAIGGSENLKPRDEDIFTAEIDEDIIAGNDTLSVGKTQDRTEARISEIGAADIVEGFDSNSPPFDIDNIDEKTLKKEKKSKSKNTDSTADALPTGEVLALLKDFADFPADLAEPLELLKVAVLNHKLAGWKEVTAPKLIKCLDMLKSLVHSVDV